MYLFHALIDRAEHAVMPPGYEHRKLVWRLHIDGNGTFVSLTKHPYKRKDDQRLAVVIPATSRTRGIRAKTGMDDATYLFGAGGRDPKARYNAYIALMRKLSEVSKAAGIIAKFLQSDDRPLFLPKDGSDKLVRACHSSPDSVEVHSYDGKCKERILVTVEGYPEWWLQPEVRRWHMQHLDQIEDAKGKKVVGNCSICLERDVVLIKTMGKSNALGGTLSSANQDSLYSYGRKDAYTSPTCRTCARSIAAGLDDVGYDSDLVRRPLGNRDIAFAWWPEDRTDPGTWPLFEVAVSKDSTKADRADAISKLTDGHLAVIEKTGNARLGLRRYGRVRGDEVRSALTRWNDIVGMSPWRLSLLLTKRQMAKSDEHDGAFEKVLISLLTQEPMPMVLVHQARRRMRRCSDEYQAKIYERFIQFSTTTDAMELTMSESTEHNAVEPATTREDAYPVDTSAKNLVPTDGLTQRERYAVLLGRIFAELEIMQTHRTRGGPQRTIGETTLGSVCRRPSRINDLVLVHGTLRRRRSSLTYPDRLQLLLEHAGEEFTKPPKRFYRSEQDQFLRGYRLHLAARRKEMAWYRERKKLSHAAAK